jgi:hypothetical protein
MSSKYVLATSSCEKRWILPNPVILSKASFLCSRRMVIRVISK